MTAKGYCTFNDVGDFLGVTLTAGQASYATRLIETVEGLVDGVTGRGWLVGAQTDETFRPADWPNDLIYLRYTPVTTIEAVNGRTALGEADTALVVDTDYEVMDLAGGVLRLIEPDSWDRITVDYTPEDSVPAAVREATAEWAAALLQPALRPDTYGLESLSLPDLSLKFARGFNLDTAPPGVALKLSVIDDYPEVGGWA